jgi:hypothetical protein
VLTKTAFAAAAIGAAASLTPVSSAPLAPPSLPVEGFAQQVHRRHHHHHGHGHRHHHHHHHRRHHHHHGHLFYGVPFAYGSYDDSNECYWLRQRALYTARPYWWDRYYACLNAYGYN